jgi:hypothetical protein
MSRGLIYLYYDPGLYPYRVLTIVPLFTNRLYEQRRLCKSVQRLISA